MNKVLILNGKTYIIPNCLWDGSKMLPVNFDPTNERWKCPECKQEYLLPSNEQRLVYATKN